MKPHPRQAIHPDPFISPTQCGGESSSAPQESVGEHSSRPQVAATQEVGIGSETCLPSLFEGLSNLNPSFAFTKTRLGEMNYLRKSHPSDPHWRKRMGSLASVKCTSQLRNNEYKISLRANMQKPQNPMAPLLTPPPCHPAKHTYIKQRDV